MNSMVAPGSSEKREGIRIRLDLLITQENLRAKELAHNGFNSNIKLADQLPLRRSLISFPALNKTERR